MIGSFRLVPWIGRRWGNALCSFGCYTATMAPLCLGRWKYWLQHLRSQCVELLSPLGKRPWKAPEIWINHSSIIPKLKGVGGGHDRKLSYGALAQRWKTAHHEEEHVPRWWSQYLPLLLNITWLGHWLFIVLERIIVCIFLCRWILCRTKLRASGQPNVLQLLWTPW